MADQSAAERHQSAQVNQRTAHFQGSTQLTYKTTQLYTVAHKNTLKCTHTYTFTHTLTQTQIHQQARKSLDDDECDGIDEGHKDGDEDFTNDGYGDCNDDVDGKETDGGAFKRAPLGRVQINKTGTCQDTLCLLCSPVIFNCIVTIMVTIIMSSPILEISKTIIIIFVFSLYKICTSSSPSSSPFSCI